MSRGQRRDVQWADVIIHIMFLAWLTVQGIRGIASLFIVTGHCVRAIIPHYLSPADEYDGTPHLFQRPYLRIIAAGPYWTSIFFLLSGYVCAIKPLRLAAAGQTDEARRVIASSSFRRLLRIGVPATLGTTFAWALCQLGVFELAGNTEYYSAWLQATTPWHTEGFMSSITDLISECVWLCSMTADLVQHLGNFGKQVRGKSMDVMLGNARVHARLPCPRYDSRFHSVLETFYAGLRRGLLFQKR